MIFSKISKFVYSTIFAFSSTCYGIEASQSVQKEQQDPNPSARWGTKRDWNLFVTAEAVWFKPIVFGIENVNNAQVLIPGTDSASIVQYKPFQNKFSSGVRTSLGYNTNYNGWDLMLVYTGWWYRQARIYENTTLNTDNTFSFKLRGKDTLEYSYNLGDLDLGRMFKISQKLKARPHVGIRALWLNQKNNVNYFDYISNKNGYSYFKVSNTLVGLEGGIDSDWKLSHNFSIYGNLTISSLINSMNPSRENLNTNTSQTLSKISWNKPTRMIGNLDVLIGLRWDKNLSHDRYHLGFNFGYEQHHYWNVNLITDGYAINEGSFSLQGLALGARFDF